MNTPTEHEINEAIKRLAKESTAPDQETPIWMENDIRRGIDWALMYVFNRKSGKCTCTGQIETMMSRDNVLIHRKHNCLKPL
jgi:hypothetical protein